METSMEAQRFDGKTRDLSKVVSRRGLVGLLGGAVTAGAGIALAARNEGLAGKRGKRKDHDREQVRSQKKGKKITICFQGQTRIIKKKALAKYPGTSLGACPIVEPPPRREPDPKPVPDPNSGPDTTPVPDPQPVVCTQWLLTGGPNQTDAIVVDDELSIFNLSQGGAGIFNEFDGISSTIPPISFAANVGNKIKIVAYDQGGCRSLSPLWLHCQATGKSRQVYQGYAGANCGYGKGTFVTETFEVWM